MGSELDAIRSELDTLDKTIVDALAERDQLVQQVATLKSDPDKPVRDLAREEALLGRIVEHARDVGLNADYVTRLFRDILDHSLRRQVRRLAGEAEQEGRRVAVVAYQGTNGSYSNQTAKRHFASADFDIELRGFHTFKQAIDAVASGDADYGVLPVENTTAGSINETYDLLAQYDLHQIGEEVHRIDHCLLAVDKVPLSRIRRILSQPQALAQCTEFLDSLDHCQAVSYTDTAMACQKIKQDQDLSGAAIASEEAGQLYGLEVIRRDIANMKDNFTRFAVVAKDAVRYDLRVACKTSLILATRHEKGALLECLQVLARHDVNLTKLESRPRPNVPWQYLFYLDLEGNVEDPEVQEALRGVSAHTSFLKVLGSYPARNTHAGKPADPKPSDASDVALETPQLEAFDLSGLEKKPYRLASRVHRVDDTIVVVGDVEIGGGAPVLIAGPRLVESQAQIDACARAVKDGGGRLLAGGCFSATAMPDSGALGFDGLDMLVRAGRSVGLPVVTEVVHPSDVAIVAKKVDVLQISSRNMQNFELLKAAGKVDRPVLLRRGTTASIDEWLTAADYILAQGNQQVILCERGIRTFETATRSTLDLTALPVVRDRTHLPVLVDPTEACGNHRWIPALVAASLAAGAHGVMVEMNVNPRGAQELPASAFASLTATM